MNEFERMSRLANHLKTKYPKGTRIMLIEMGDDPRPIPPHTKGTIEFVDDMGTLHCTFDNGRILGIVPAEDSFRKLTQEEIEEENNAICVEETTDNLVEESGMTQSM